MPGSSTLSTDTVDTDKVRVTRVGVGGGRKKKGETASKAATLSWKTSFKTRGKASRTVHKSPGRLGWTGRVRDGM